jgi:RNA exonuclease 1
MPFPTHTSSSTAKSQLPIIPKLFSHACPTRAPGDQRRLHSALNALLQAPLTEGEKKRREQAKARKAALKNEQPMSNNDPRQYLLTPHEMLDNDYPIPDYVKLGDEVFIPGRSTPPPPAQSIEKDAAKMDWRTTWNLNPDKKGHGPGWVETPLAEPQQDGATWRVLAMDCEMVSCLHSFLEYAGLTVSLALSHQCKAGEEQILARVSVVDCATGQKVYDELCVPEKPITDYVTA